MLKVLVIHTKYKFRGGEDTVVSEEIKLLESNGVIVRLLEFNNISNSFLKLVQVVFNVQSYYRTKKELSHFEPDIIHIHNLHFGASASIVYAAKRKKIPFVKTIHNYRLICPSGTLFYNGKLFLDSVKQHFPWSAVKNGVYKNSKIITFWVSLSMYIHNKLGTWKYCNQFITLSSHAKKILLDSQLQLNDNQISIKSNFSDAPVLKDIKPGKHFLYIGRLTEEKGIELVLSVFSSCPYNIKIAGDGPLKNLVLEHETKYSNIEFFSSVDKSTVYELMQNCSALIFPSIWFEGMPLTIIEAFACRTIVIASKLGAMESMIIPNYNGFHFEPNNEKELRNCLDDWYNMKEEQKDVYRLNAFNTFEQNYTPEKNVKQLLDIYTKAIENNIVIN